MKELRKAGLTEYEEKAYLALLELGIAGGGDISKKSGVPKTRIYDVLKDLSEKRLVNILQKKPMLFKAVRPEIALKHLFEKRIQELKKAEIDAIKILKQVKKKPTPKIHEKVITILGFEGMYNLFMNWAQILPKRKLMSFLLEKRFHKL